MHIRIFLGTLLFAQLVGYDAHALGPAQQKIITIFERVVNLMGNIFVGIAVIMFLYSGYLYIISAGNRDIVRKAQNTLVWAVIGTTVGLLAFAIPGMVSSILNG